jgi:hypothetical protein
MAVPLQLKLAHRGPMKQLPDRNGKLAIHIPAATAGATVEDCFLS